MLSFPWQDTCARKQVNKFLIPLVKPDWASMVGNKKQRDLRFRVALECIGRHSNDRDLDAGFSNQFGSSYAVYNGHIDIHKDKVV